MVDGGSVADGYLGKAVAQSRGFCFANMLLGLELVLGAGLIGRHRSHVPSISTCQSSWSGSQNTKIDPSLWMGSSREWQPRPSRTLQHTHDRHHGN
jgi:hypothetical protein